MDAFLTSGLVVAIAEIGDKTQLLSFLLACRFCKPLPILAGILAATLANHAVAGLIGEWIGDLLTPAVLRWVLTVSFAAMAAWALVPDKLDDGEALRGKGHGVFVITLASFFVAEIGDKTQIATAALAARFEAVVPVILGTTIGMLLANAPVVLGAHLAGHRVDLRWVRYVAAALFAGQAVLTLAGYGFL